jgi:4-hydroxybenzoate polyprenyltransferase
MIISLAAYCAGLVINDLADYKEDLRDRPSRPLPSGAVSRRTALILAIVFIAIAIGTAACVSLPVFITTLCLLALILLYNLLAKRSGFFGPWVMGLCRGASVQVGVSSVMPWPWHHNDGFVLVLVITLYVVQVSRIARNETSDPSLPPFVGFLIRVLLYLQAIACISAGGVFCGTGWICALLLLALWPVSRLVASRFYAS